jgi:Heterokaryon incompatibility protein (HET)
VGSHLGKICRRCEQFDFSSIFDPDTAIPPSTGCPIKPILNSCTSEMEAASCPICRLFAAVRFPRDPPVCHPEGQYHLRAHSSLKLHNLRRTRKRVSSRPSIALSVESGNAVKKDTSGAYMMAYGLITQVASPATFDCLGQYDYFGSEVNPDSVNFNAVKLWLSQCEQQHTSTCESRQITQVPSLRVIDCDTLKVVLWGDVLPGHDYFALSYVWNKPDPSITQTDCVTFRAQLIGSLLPQVMVDAIEVVKKVRPQASRYLWVDRYCIDQCDAEEKHSQIKAMDLIYEGAFATVIAASTDGSEAGLPGVGPTSRRVQPSAIANGIFLASTLPHVSTVLKDTA